MSTTRFASSHLASSGASSHATAASTLGHSSASIWSACRTGDAPFVAEFIAQEAEAEEAAAAAHASSHAKRRRGVGGGASAAAQSHFTASDRGLAQTAHDRTPLVQAAVFQRRGVLAQLLAGGCPASQVDGESGWSALAHTLYRGDFLSAAVLVRGGANLTKFDHAGLTPLDLVQQHVHDARMRREDNGNGRTPGQAGRRYGRGALVSDSSAFGLLASSATASVEQLPHNLLFSLGYQSQYTLGYSCEHYQHRARMVDAFGGAGVRQVLALRTAVFVRLDDGTVASHGQGQSGKLGHEAKETLIEPKRIASLHSIAHIAATDEYVCAVNEKGHVFAFGFSVFLTDAPTSAPSKSSAAFCSASSSSSSRLQPSSHSPPPTSRTLDGSASTAAHSPFAPPMRYSQLPRRIDALRSLSVAQVFPSASRLLVLTHSGELWFLGQSLEDAERWETHPKRFAAPIQEPIVQVANREDFVAILTTAGAIRIQRRGERKLNKLWLQNYPEQGPPQNTTTRIKTIRDLFPLIPKAHVVKMAWTTDGARGAAVTREGQLFMWKLPVTTNSNTHESKKTNAGDGDFVTHRSSSTGGGAFPRCIGYLVEGLSRVRVVDVSIASGHTNALTEDGHVYTFGPACLGHTHPHETTAATTSSMPATTQPRRLLHLSQVSQIHASEQYLLVLVGVEQPLVLPSFPELRGLHDEVDGRRKVVLAPVEVPSLRLMCQHHLAEQITPLSVLAAYQWAFNTDSTHLLHYCTQYLLDNLAFYLPALLAVPDVACLQALQSEYAHRYPIWFYSPQWTQPIQSQQDEFPEFGDAASFGLETTASTPPPADAEQEGESFSFSHALAQLKAASRKAAQPLTAEERVGELKVRRRALVKKLAQIDSLAQQKPRVLQAEQRDKLVLREKHASALQDLDAELLTLRDQGSVSAAQLWDQIHGVVSEARVDHAAMEEAHLPEEARAVALVKESEEKAVAEQAEAEKQQQQQQEKAKARVAGDLLNRPVRALGAAKPAVVEVEQKINRKKVETVVPVVVAPTPAPVRTTPSASWKSPAPNGSTIPASAATPSTLATVATSSPKPVALSSFAAIQAEEARASEAARAHEANKVHSATRNQPQRPPSGIVPTGSKGWGAAAIVSPVISATSTPQTDFPSLGAALPPASLQAQHASPLFKAATSGRSLPLTASSHSPPLRSTAAPTFAPGSSVPASGFFSLADFMPALPKPKPAPAKGWNTGAVAPAVEVPAAAAAPADTKTKSQAPAASNAPQQKTPKKASKAAIQSSPSSSPTAPSSSLPVSLLSIQRDEALSYLGPASGFKTQRELDWELEQASLASSRSAWNSMHVPTSTVAAGPGLADLQAQELAVLLAEEDRVAAKAAQVAKKKQKKALAQARDASLAAAAAAAAEAAKQQSKKPKTPRPAKHMHQPASGTPRPAPQPRDRQPQQQPSVEQPATQPHPQQPQPQQGQAPRSQQAQQQQRQPRQPRSQPRQPPPMKQPQAPPTPVQLCANAPAFQPAALHA